MAIACLARRSGLQPWFMGLLQNFDWRIFIFCRGRTRGSAVVHLLLASVVDIGLLGEHCGRVPIELVVLKDWVTETKDTS
jgi:hypothetical protein